MKQLAIILVIFIGCFQCASIPLPGQVKKTFQKMHKGECDPDWKKGSHGNYEAHFKKDGIHYRADYKPNANG